jgi:hypothetical protein
MKRTFSRTRRHTDHKVVLSTNSSGYYADMVCSDATTN